jgi:hypothetical protein
MALIAAFDVVFPGPRAMRNGLETRNGVGGEDHAWYGYHCLAPSGRSNFLVYNRSVLGLCITTLTSVPSEFRREQWMRSMVQLIAS